MSIGAMRSCNKWQQATMTLPIAMYAMDSIANCDGRNQCNHCEMPKRSWEEPLKCNKEGRGNQHQSHKAALSTNATRALWGRCEYHNNTHTAMTNIAAMASIVVKRAQRTQTATFCQPAQESRVVSSMQWRQLLSPSAWPMQTTTTTCKQQSNNNQKQSRHDTYTTHHACDNCWTSSESSCLAEPVTPSSMTKEQAQATTTKNTILLVLQK